MGIFKYYAIHSTILKKYLDRRLEIWINEKEEMEKISFANF